MIIVLCSLEVGPMLELNKQWLKVLTKEDFICLMMPLADFCRNWSKFRLVKNYCVDERFHRSKRNVLVGNPQETQVQVFE